MQAHTHTHTHLYFMYTMMTAVMTMATTSSRMTTMMGTVIWMACWVVRPGLPTTTIGTVILVVCWVVAVGGRGARERMEYIIRGGIGMERRRACLAWFEQPQDLFGLFTILHLLDLSIVVHGIIGCSLQALFCWCGAAEAQVCTYCCVCGVFLIQ